MTDVGSAVLSEEQRTELRVQVDHAIEAHYVWLDRLQTAVKTGRSVFDLAEVAREDLCPIGVWLNSTISEALRTMPLYYVTKSRHAVFHRSMARLLAATVAGRPQAALSLRPDGDMTIVAVSLLRTLHDWRAIATAQPSDPHGASSGPATCSAVNRLTTSMSRLAPDAERVTK